MMKKSIILVIICLVFGALSTQLSAQSESGWYTSLFYTQLECDGTFLGYVGGVMNFHVVDHYNKDGEWVFANYMARGEATCSFSDENFTYQEKGKEWLKNDAVGHYIIHLKGDQGSKFQLHVTIDYKTTPATWTFVKANCH
jgi:hypothetical protein